MLAAVTEVIKSQGGSETETEYFAALVRHYTIIYYFFIVFYNIIVIFFFKLLVNGAAVLDLMVFKCSFNILLHLFTNSFSH